MLGWVMGTRSEASRIMRRLSILGSGWSGVLFVRVGTIRFWAMWPRRDALPMMDERTFPLPARSQSRGFGWDCVADVVGGEFAAGSDEFGEGGFDVVGVVVVSDCCGCEGCVLPVQPELLTSSGHQFVHS